MFSTILTLPRLTCRDPLTSMGGSLWPPSLFAVLSFKRLNCFIIYKREYIFTTMKKKSWNNLWALCFCKHPLFLSTSWFYNNKVVFQNELRQSVFKNQSRGSELGNPPNVLLLAKGNKQIEKIKKFWVHLRI